MNLHIAPINLYTLCAAKKSNQNAAENVLDRIYLVGGKFCINHTIITPGIGNNITLTNHKADPTEGHPNIRMAESSFKIKDDVINKFRIVVYTESPEAHGMRAVDGKRIIHTLYFLDKDQKVQALNVNRFSNLHDLISHIKDNVYSYPIIETPGKRKSAYEEFDVPRTQERPRKRLFVEESGSSSSQATNEPAKAPKTVLEWAKEVRNYILDYNFTVGGVINLQVGDGELRTFKYERNGHMHEKILPKLAEEIVRFLNRLVNDGVTALSTKQFSECEKFIKGVNASFKKASCENRTKFYEKLQEKLLEKNRSHRQAPDEQGLTIPATPQKPEKTRHIIFGRRGRGIS